MNRIDGERGVSGFLVAGSLLLMMGIAAIALDISAGYAERRQDQTAADAAAQAAGVELIAGGGLDAQVAAAQTAASTNLDSRALDWAGCTDPDQLEDTSAELGATGGTACISFGNNTQGVAYARIRVRIPDQETPTVFGRVLGALNIVTHADAIVEVGGELPYRNFPSFVFSPAQAGDRYCIRTGAGTTDEQNCSGSTTGNFGMFLPYFYSDEYGLECVSGDQSAPSAFAIAEGIDHTIAANPGLAKPQVLNGDDCPGVAGPLNPNQIEFSAGNNPNVTDGLIKGGNTPTNFTGRLTRNTWGVGIATVFGRQIDNRPLWSYIDDTWIADQPGMPFCKAAAAGPDSVSDPADSGFLQAMEDMQKCLKNGPPTGLFTADIYDSPRLATVPKLYQAAPCGSLGCPPYDVTDFVPIFLETLYTDNGPHWTCDGGIISDTANDFCRHDAGRTGSMTVDAVGLQKVESVGGIIITCDSLPGPGTAEEKCRLIGSGAGSSTTYLNLFFLE